MTSTKNQFSTETLSQKELRRYCIQINNTQIGLAGQEKIKKYRILVIGAGGKGSAILQNLSIMGVGKLGISDNSFIEEIDLSRQHLYGNNDLGKHKAIVAKQKLQEINPLISFEVHNVFIIEKNIEILCKNYDLLIDATDNLQAHLLISDKAVKLNIPVIYTSIAETIGQISIFNYKNESSYRNIAKLRSTLINSTTEKDFSCQASTLSIIGAIVANETIKIILELETPLNTNLLTFNVSEYTFVLEPLI
jgi:molybdopterin/thiamine biosynthesis adenylyltransferase